MTDKFSSHQLIVLKLEALISLHQLIVLKLVALIPSHQLIVLKLEALILSVIVNYGWKDVAFCYNQYQSQLASAEEEKNEFLQWKAMCTKMKEGDRTSTDFPP